MEGSTGTNTVINNGSVDEIIGGDKADQITNNDSIGWIDSGSGDDTITNAGTVTNNINVYNGDDTVVLTGEQPAVQGNITGGEYGEDKGDTLEFNMSTSDENLFNQARADIAAADPDNGTLTWGTSTFTWSQFEILYDNLNLVVAANNVNGGNDDGATSTITYSDVYVSVIKKGGTLYFFGKNSSTEYLLTTLYRQDYSGGSTGQVLKSISFDQLGVLLYVELREDGNLLVQYYSTVTGSLLSSMMISV